MPAKTEYTTSNRIITAPLPNHGATYTVIPHKEIIIKTREELEKKGFEISAEIYKSNYSSTVAQGIYHLSYGDDPDMKLMFAWSNSYDKTMTFKCSVGAFVVCCLNNVVHGDLDNYSRKHTGTAATDAFTYIEEQISLASEYYDKLIEDKKLLSDLILSKKQQAEILGVLYADIELLTLTQVGIVKREMDKPSFFYTPNDHSAWNLYNHITLSLKESHPKSFLDDHSKLHNFFVGKINKPIVKTPTINHYNSPSVVFL